MSLLPAVVLAVAAPAAGGGSLQDMVLQFAPLLFLLVAGSTFLSSMLNPRQHLVLALIFWIACVWFTITALLLALFDLAAVRREARREQRELKRSYASVIESDDKRDGNPRSP